MSPDVNLRSSQYFAPGTLHTSTPQLSDTQQVSAQPAATGKLCVGSISGIPIFANDVVAQTPGLNLSSGSVQSASAIGHHDFARTANASYLSAGNPVSPSAASGLVCIGSLNGVPVFSAPMTHAGNIQSITPSGVSMSYGVGVASAARGLICIGNFNGQPVFTLQQSETSVASANVASATGPTAAPAATGLVCIGSLSGAPLFVFQPEPQSSPASFGATGQFSQGANTTGNGSGLTAAGMCG